MKKLLIILLSLLVVGVVLSPVMHKQYRRWKLRNFEYDVNSVSPAMLEQVNQDVTNQLGKRSV